MYRSVSVKDVRLDSLKELADGDLTVGLDIAKEEVLVVVRDKSGEFLRPWKAKQPTELGTLMELFRALAKDRSVIFGLESTGTYGDALRQAMSDLGLEVHRVSGKAKSDYEEVFDGVPSAHDGKDAAIIAELVALGKSQSWPHQQASEFESRMKGCVDWLDAQQDIYQTWLGRLEARLARYWPEATRILELTSGTLLRMLADYGGPAKVADAPDAADQLRGWGGNFLSESKIRAICSSAQKTIGVRMTSEEELQLQRYASQALEARREINKTKKQLQDMCEGDALLRSLASVVGSPTACVLFVSLGDPNRYHCAEAYRKAMGLNLKEHSSGKHKGKLKITKRGSSQARRWLYFTALRLIQKPDVRGWYEVKKKKDQGKGGRAVTAVMRKLALAIWHVVVRGVTFDPRRLFPGKPMGALPPNPRDLSLSC
jgi:transposase